MKKLLIIIAVLFTSYSYGQWDLSSTSQEINVKGNVSHAFRKLEFLHVLSNNKQLLFIYNDKGQCSNYFTFGEKIYSSIKNGITNNWYVTDKDGENYILCFIEFYNGTKKIVLISDEFYITYK
jgi:hypothetical protein